MYRGYYRKMKEVADLEFPAYGSLYFIDSLLSSASKQTLDKEFCIGTHCGPRYWDCNVSDSRYNDMIEPNQGPCK